MMRLIIIFLLFSTIVYGQDFAWIESPLPVKFNIHEEVLVNSLGSNVNTQFHEKLPIISPDGKTLYFEREGNFENSFGLGDIYFSTLDPSGNWTEAKNIGMPLNNKGHNFISSISPDGNILLLGNTYNPDGSHQGGGVSISFKTDAGWSLPKNLQIENFNNINRYGSFFLSNDSRYLLMGIENKQSMGKLDLYVSFKDSLGNWVQPFNLGNTINTALSETNPFLASDGKTLYFASEGLKGYGGYDIYMSRRIDSTWTKWSVPVNLGAFINTAGHEISFSIAASGKEAFCYGVKEKSQKCDIFHVSMDKLAALKPADVALVSGKVLNAKTGLPVAASIHYESLENGFPPGESITDLHKGTYTVIIPVGNHTGYFAKSPGYISIDQHVDLTNGKGYREWVKDLYLVPLKAGEIIQMNNVFFPQSKPDLLPSSFHALNRLVELMRAYPSLHIELRGHTDNQGDPQKNFYLSEDRVKAVKKFLAEKGIQKKRISLKAFGGADSISSNQTEEGRKLNRRVEFKIIKI